MIKNGCILALTQKGAETALCMARAWVQSIDRVEICVPQKLFATLGAVPYSTLGDMPVPENIRVQPFECWNTMVETQWKRCDALVFITAAGIAVRAIAPYVRDKMSDPAVLVAESSGRFIISLLSGHLGGANALAARLAETTGGQAVITTATDCAGVPSVDMLAQQAGLRIANRDAIKVINMALLAHETVLVCDKENALGVVVSKSVGVGEICEGKSEKRERVDKVEESGGHEGSGGKERHERKSAEFFTPVDTLSPQDCRAAVLVSEHVPNVAELPPRTLVLHPTLYLGLGCKKNVPFERLMGHIERVFARENLPLAAVASVASADAKKEEAAMHGVATRLGVPITFYSAERLNGVSVPNPSARVSAAVGTPSVSEAAALYSARCAMSLNCNSDASLLVPKTADCDVTLAVARLK